MEMQFSQLAEDLGGSTNPLYALRDKLQGQGEIIVDLVRGSVNEHGIVFPPDTLHSILADAMVPARQYRPDSFGQPVAREAIASYYAELNFTAEQILLTPGTSLSFLYCFKLLAEVGDEIICPQPSYPLFDYIARICGVDLLHYRLLESRQWSIDLDHLNDQISTRTRAILLISPHNPTGMVADDEQLAGVAEIAQRHNLPIIADEVFSEFLFGIDRLPRPAATEAPLVFTLNGFSKMFALPGMKLGWMAVSGDEALVRKSLQALEMIADTFLPVNEIVQFSVPGVFARGRAFQQSYVAWIAQCHEKAMAGLAGLECSLDFNRPQGGFYLTVPTHADEDEVAMALLGEHKILTHPGYYYDIEPNHLVMTIVNDPQTLAESFHNIARATKHD